MTGPNQLVTWHNCDLAEPPIRQFLDQLRESAEFAWLGLVAAIEGVWTSPNILLWVRQDVRVVSYQGHHIFYGIRLLPEEKVGMVAVLAYSDGDAPDDVVRGDAESQVEDTLERRAAGKRQEAQSLLAECLRQLDIPSAL